MSQSKVNGFCPMGCGQTLWTMSGDNIECIASDCPDPHAVAKILEDRETEHVVHFGRTVFTVRHPLRERLGDQLLRCELHNYCFNLDGPPVPPGSYRATGDGDQWDFTPVPEGTPA